jgi:hypothetical protein
MQPTNSIAGIVGEPAQLTAPVSINEIAHSWEQVKEAQKAAIFGELKLVQATLELGITLRRAESQMGQERLFEEIEEKGIEEHTAKYAMKMATDNPGGISQIAADEKKFKQYAEQLTFPSTEKHKEDVVDKDLPPWELSKGGLRLNANPDQWHRYGASYSADTFFKKTEDILRIWVELGRAKLTA